MLLLGHIRIDAADKGRQVGAKMTMDYMFNYTSLVNIPAYDASGSGLIIEIKLSSTASETFFLQAKGRVALALQRNFKRIIDIMCSMKKSWECLGKLRYLLECNQDSFVVRDSKSSSLALSIALINLHRAIHGQTQVLGLCGTGVLRIDGTFDNAELENEKHLAAKQSLKHFNKFITPQESKNLFELENVIHQLKRS